MNANSDKAMAELGMARAMHQLQNALISRNTFSNALGKSYQGERDIYTAMGYPKDMLFSRFNARFTRQDIAKRVVRAYPDGTWAKAPRIFETESPESETAFEKAWDQVLKAIRVFHYLRRVDTVGRVGRYGVLFMGFDDGQKFEQPVTRAKSLLYLQPYSEDHATIESFVKDKKDPRFGLPEFYSLTRTDITSGSSTTTVKEKVHWSRCIHAADGAVESDVFGTPALECIYNRLQDIELIAAGSAEMFWRGAFPGYSFEAAADAELDQTDATLEDEIEKYMHGMNRYLKLQGIEAKSLAPQVSSPEKQVDVQIKLISSGTGIPQRILTGSEMGELASSQDKVNWNSRIGERREDYAEPMILRAFIDRLIEVGVLPKPKEETGYTVEWPDLDQVDEAKVAATAKTITEALGLYVRWGVEEVIPPAIYLSKIMNLSDEEIEAAMAELDLMRADEAKLEEERAEIEEEIRLEEEAKAKSLPLVPGVEE